MRRSYTGVLDVLLISNGCLIVNSQLWSVRQPILSVYHLYWGKMSNSNNIDETVLSAHMAAELTFTQDRKEETLNALKEDVEAALDKEVKALDADAWKFAAPRSQIHLISRAGSQSSRWLESTRQELMEAENFHKVDKNWRSWHFLKDSDWPGFHRTHEVVIAFYHYLIVWSCKYKMVVGEGNIL